MAKRVLFYKNGSWFSSSDSLSDVERTKARFGDDVTFSVDGYDGEYHTIKEFEDAKKANLNNYFSTKSREEQEQDREDAIKRVAIKRATRMENITIKFNDFLNEGKKGQKKKSEKSAIIDRYREYKNKIQDKKNEYNKIYKSDDTAQVKNKRLDIKRVEILMAEKELDIVRLRDRKLLLSRELKIAEEKEKGKKK